MEALDCGGFSPIETSMEMAHASPNEPVAASQGACRATRETIRAASSHPGVKLAVFDNQWKLRWCDEGLACLYGASAVSMAGLELDEIVGPEAGAERRRLCRPCLERGEKARYACMCGGRRTLVTVFPLDAGAFGHEGVVMVCVPATSPEEGAGLPVISVPSLGSGLGKLSKAELCVAYLFAAGLTVQQIGERLCRSEHTVNDHIKALHRKLNVSRQVELATFLAHAGIAGFTEAEWCTMTGASIPNPSPAVELKPMADTRAAG